MGLRLPPRNARRLFERMGIRVEELTGVESVVIKLRNKDLVINSPSVSKIVAQDAVIFQVVGREIEEISSIKIPEEDVLLVAQQTGVSVEVARRALEESGGDLAKAILLLTAR